MRIQILGIALIAFAGSLCAAAGQTAYVDHWRSEAFTAPDRPTTINGIRVACDGVGLDERSNPAWNDYALKLSFVGSDGQYLGDEHIDVTGNGHEVSMRCQGPWAMLDLPAGTYRVAADVDQIGSRNFTARVSGLGQTKIAIRFPNAGGRIASSQP